MARDNAINIIKRYLEDAIAAEHNFESQLRQFSSEGDRPDVQQFFADHAEETRRQHKRLTARLEALGGSPSGIKSFLAHLFGFAPRTAQVGHEEAERSTQNLIMAYAVENSEVAMYEVLASVAAAAGDVETEQLARTIQSEERLAASRIWELISDCARDAYRRMAVEEAGTVR